MWNYRLLFVIHFILCVNNAIANSNNVAESWISLAREAKNLMINKCSFESTTPWECIQKTTLNLFDKIIECNVIPITESVRLRQYPNSENNSTDKKKNIVKRSLPPLDYLTLIGNDTWQNHILNKIASTFDTHVLEIDLSSPGNENIARHRHRNQMLPMMVFGMTALGLITVPIGFQFLAMLGGKALLLAKMALLLASINGLRRVASSGVHYGLYHAPTPHHHGYYERGPDEIPRQFNNYSSFR